MPHHSDVQNGSRSRSVRREPLYWLPSLHASLPIYNSQIRLRKLRAEDPQMHILLRPLGGWAGPGLRDRMPYRRDQLRRPRRHGYRSEAAVAAAPGTYIPEIYGLDEVGGTSVLHLSSVPFEQIGYITGLPKTPMPDLTHRWLRVTAPVFAVLYGLFAALNWIVRRRMRHQGHEGEHT